MRDEYSGCSLIADPIHRYIPFTVPKDAGEVAEKDLIDSPWFQRLRYIFQLQSARWVYPSAEHSRFQHCLGAMHLAGVFARGLYPSLRKVLGEECPSPAYVEEYMRITGLLHDVGHGPFCHFFDNHFLSQHGPDPRRHQSGHHPRASGGDHPGHPPQPHGFVCRRRRARSGRHCLSHQEGFRGRSRQTPVAPVPPASDQRHLHLRQPGLRVARFVHVRRGGGAHRPGKAHLLHLHLTQGADPAPFRRGRPHHVPERAQVPLRKRLLSPHHPGHRRPPPGVVPGNHGPDRAGQSPGPHGTVPAPDGLVAAAGGVPLAPARHPAGPRVGPHPRP